MSFLQFSITLDKSVILLFNVLATEIERLKLTHIIYLNEVVPVVVIVDTLDTDCQGTGFAEVFDRLVRVKIAWYKVIQFYSCGISY